MKPNQIRRLIFPLHRYIGLILGLLLILIGVTGSLLVFKGEIENWIISRQFGTVVPQGQPIAAEHVVEIAKSTYPTWNLAFVDWPSDNRHPLSLRMLEPNADPDLHSNMLMQGIHQVLINPYTGKVMGDRAEGLTFYRLLLTLHYRLFVPGESGVTITGIAALFLLIVSITGIVLWPGWRKLSVGLKIKWDAHVKRLNFDLHKVAGITTAIFLGFTAFTGFCWAFPDFTNPIIYAATFSTVSESESVSVSKPQPDQKMASPKLLLGQAKKALPEMQVWSLGFPYSETEPFTVHGRAGETVNIDPYTAQVLKVEVPRPTKLSLGDRILHSFESLHYGTFWGLPSRILYVFVGLAPLILFITGLVMWWHRYRGGAQIKREIRTHPRLRRLFSIKSIRGSLTQRRAGSRRNL